MSDLKPCPFCGGKAIMKVQKHIPNGYDYTPTCQDPSCAGRLTKKWTNEAIAIEAWNQRAMGERTAKVKKGAYDLMRCECGMPVTSNYDYCPKCRARLEWEQ
jgi:Lar family restriction alleviation protein